MVLGLLPDCDLGQVSSAANAAGTGARVALLNRSSRQEISRRARQIEKVETAVDPDFQQYFVEAMALPHATQRYERLAHVVRLPERRDNVDVRARGLRRKHPSCCLSFSLKFFPILTSYFLSSSIFPSVNKTLI